MLSALGGGGRALLTSLITALVSGFSSTSRLAAQAMRLQGGHHTKSVQACHRHKFKVLQSKLTIGFTVTLHIKRTRTIIFENLFQGASLASLHGLGVNF
jgi:hypothetical protein